MHGAVEANLKLTPQPVVTGRIVDEDGDPLANARVNFSRYEWRNGNGILSPGRFKEDREGCGFGEEEEVGHESNILKVVVGSEN